MAISEKNSERFIKIQIYSENFGKIQKKSEYVRKNWKNSGKIQENQRKILLENFMRGLIIIEQALIIKQVGFILEN